MLNRKSPGEIVDVDGYDHIIRNNLSYKPRAAGKHIVDVNREECTIINNSFLPVDMTVGEDDFVSLDPAQLTLPRKADGSLPDIDFLKLKEIVNYMMRESVFNSLRRIFKILFCY